MVLISNKTFCKLTLINWYFSKLKRNLDIILAFSDVFREGEETWHKISIFEVQKLSSFCHHKNFCFVTKFSSNLLGEQKFYFKRNNFSRPLLRWTIVNESLQTRLNFWTFVEEMRFQLVLHWKKLNLMWIIQNSSELKFKTKNKDYI